MLQVTKLPSSEESIPEATVLPAPSMIVTDFSPSGLVVRTAEPLRNSPKVTSVGSFHNKSDTAAIPVASSKYSYVVVKPLSGSVAIGTALGSTNPSG